MKKQVNALGDMEISSKEMQAALKANADGGDQNYIGLNDDMLNFGEAESFIDETESGKNFTIRLTNTTEETQVVQFGRLLGIALEEGVVLLKEGVLVEVDGSHKFSAKGTPRSVDILLALIDKTPMHIHSIKFNVNNQSQLDEPIKYLTETAFAKGTEKQVTPSDFHDQDTNNVNTVEVSFKDWILAYDSTVQYSVLPGETVTLVIKLGASIDPANALRTKYKAAVKTAAKYYARQQG